MQTPWSYASSEMKKDFNSVSSIVAEFQKQKANGAKDKDKDNASDAGLSTSTATGTTATGTGFMRTGNNYSKSEMRDTFRSMQSGGPDDMYETSSNATGTSNVMST